jgi:bifunctional DNA-binding transcriptional regulator/antitoxin component of YhaV-PrlF toxin-antitoxin module
METSMRITAKGQVTIPQHLRRRAGLMPGTDVAFEFDGAVVRLVKADGRETRATRGERLVERLDGAGSYGMSTDEVLALMRGRPADDELHGRE